MIIPTKKQLFNMRLIDAVVTNVMDDGTGGEGNPGFSPTITMEDTGEGVKLSILDVNGIQTTLIKHGLPGIDGVNGKDGADGKDGESAYEIARKHGFEGDEEAWLESLRGLDVEELMKYIGKITLLKPVNDDGHSLHLSAVFYEDKDCTQPVLTINTNADDDIVKANVYAFVGANNYDPDGIHSRGETNVDKAWIRLNDYDYSDGLSHEFDNYPVMIDLKPFINNDFISKLKEHKHFYVKYSWYWYGDDGTGESTFHYSDEFSLVFPSICEVGATAGASKKNKNKALNTIQSVDDEEEKYVIYPEMPNIIDPNTCTLTADTDILLDDYLLENQYKLQFTVGPAPVELTFYVQNALSQVSLPEQTLTDSAVAALKNYYNDETIVKFKANTKYIITIELGMVTQIAAVEVA